MKPYTLPDSEYGVLRRETFDTEIDEIAGQIRRLGYGILDVGWSLEQVEEFRAEFDRTASDYIRRFGEERLRGLDEHNTVRAPLAHGGPRFMELATNPILLSLLSRLISGNFILNQQNGIINPPNAAYNQASWHRDLPYQHFVSDSPLAVNALFCVDDFTRENGSTLVLPASHKVGAFPSQGYIEKNAIQLEAKAGQFLVLDCMVFHAGGYNSTNSPRRAVNHVYTIPYFKQQIKLPRIIDPSGLDSATLALLGFNGQEPDSLEQYLEGRGNRTSTNCKARIKERTHEQDR